MGLSLFIKNNVDAIVASWEALASALPPAQAMSNLVLREHSRGILLFIASGMARPRSDAERAAEPRSSAAAANPPSGSPALAAEHGALRPMAGVDLAQLFAEFRALRASVTSSWRQSGDAEASGPAALEDLIRFNEALDEAVAQSVQRHAAEMAESRDMFLAVLGHDLRAPLAGIDMSALLLSKPGLSEVPRQQAAARIKRASREMGQLVNDLLEYTRKRLGAGIPITLSPCDLGALCEESVEAVRAAHPRQRFVHRLFGDLALDADAPRMRQALSNLLNNAVQHSDPGAAVMLAVEGRADAVVLKVTHNGPPVPAQALQSVFEPLVQHQGEGADLPERSKTSLGLGLFIVREIVLGHGGTVQVESTSGSGTMFTLRLPRKPA